MSIRTVVVVVAVALTGCVDLSVPSGGRIRCSSTTDCPSGLACRASISECVAADAETVAPKISDVLVAPAQISHVAGHDSATLTFNVDDATALVSVDANGAPLVCTAGPAGSAAVSCAGITVDSLAAQSDGPVAISISATDALGNRGVASASVVVDTKAPALLDGSVIEPAIARAGDLVLVRVPLSEPLGDDAAPALASDDGALAFELQSDDGGLLTFTHSIASGDDGTYSLVVKGAVDEAGNASDALAIPGALVVDTQAPAFVSLTADSGRYSAVDGFDVITVASELDDVPAAFAVDIDGAAFDCAPDDTDAQREECTFAVVASDWPAGESAHQIVAVATDAAGNNKTASLAVTLDFVPPDVVDGSVTLALNAPAGSAVSHVSALGLGASASISFVVTEALAADPIASASTPALAVSAAHEVGLLYAATATLTSTDVVEAPQTITLALVDEVGNAASVPLVLPAPGVVPDVTAPTSPAVDASGVVTYRRAPHGSIVDGAIAHFSVVCAACSEPSATVIASDDAGNEIGRASAGADGSALVALVPADRDHVLVRTVDVAGNASAPVLVRDTALFAALNGRVVGSDGVVGGNGTALFAVPDLDLLSGLLPGAAHEVDASAAAVVDGNAVVSGGAGHWTERGFDTVPAQPSSRTGHCAAWDLARGVLVLFGGTDRTTGALLGDTWEWDG
ncbi:MAG TPA: hypothetical protein VGO62_19730, partial [Myxococcota bacterium]